MVQCQDPIAEGTALGFDRDVMLADKDCVMRWSRNLFMPDDHELLASRCQKAEGLPLLHPQLAEELRENQELVEAVQQQDLRDAVYEEDNALERVWPTQT